MNADNEEPTLNKGAEKVGGVIPEIFFDVIARVIPGSVFLLAYCLTYRLPVSPILDPDAVRPKLKSIKNMSTNHATFEAETY